MARYIDADALIDKLKELKEEWGFTFTADGVEEAIFKVEEEPTADVVPKSEVAREIFEEIEKMMYKLLNDRLYIAADMSVEIAELKKKYTEGGSDYGGKQ